MAQVVGKYAAKKMLGKQMEKYRKKDVAGDIDPYFTYVTKPNGKKKKVKKQIPDYIPDPDATILAKMRKRAYALDMCLFSAFGVRFGWSSVIGLIPAAGDAIDASLALLLAYRCMQVDCKGKGLPKSVRLHMLFNVLVDFLIGLVPFLGDIADAAYKANTKNLRLLERELDRVYKPKAMKEAEIQDEKMGTPRPPPATVYEDFSDDDDEERLPRYRNEMQEAGVMRPQQAMMGDERRGGPKHDSKRQHSRQNSKRHVSPAQTPRPSASRGNSRR